MGIGRNVAKSTLSRANENRDYRIFRDFALTLIRHARDLYVEPSNLDLEQEIRNGIYALDATLIDLCVTVFTWARFRKYDSAVKLHTLLDIHNSIPCYVDITKGNVHEMNILDKIPFEPEGFYIMDRGYMDFKRLYKLHQSQAYFVIRARNNIQNDRIRSRPVDKSTGVCYDQVIKLNGFYAKQKYPATMRKIKFYDAENKRYMIILTNNFELTALDIAKLYKHRWKIELFFKWIKQHLKIKSFWGYSENAVKTQIWIAISVYVLVAIIKKQLKLHQSMYIILQILSINPFDKTPLNELFAKTDLHDFKEQNPNQLILF